MEPPSRSRAENPSRQAFGTEPDPHLHMLFLDEEHREDGHELLVGEQPAHDPDVEVRAFEVPVGGGVEVRRPRASRTPGRSSPGCRAPRSREARRARRCARPRPRPWRRPWRWRHGPNGWRGGSRGRRIRVRHDVGDDACRPSEPEDFPRGDGVSGRRPTYDAAEVPSNDTPAAPRSRYTRVPHTESEPWRPTCPATPP